MGIFHQHTIYVIILMNPASCFMDEILSVEEIPIDYRTAIAIKYSGDPSGDFS